MKLLRAGLSSLLLTVVIGVTVPSVSAQAPAPMGKLILSGDLVLFGTNLKEPNLCTMRSRYKRGEAVGFRMTAIDGGTGEVEKTADIIIHVTQGGKTVDVPARYRGYDPPKPFGPIPYLWTAKWVVPSDAPIGIVRFNVTAKDNKGRTAEWTIFQNNPDALLTVVE